MFIDKSIAILLRQLVTECTNKSSPQAIRLRHHCSDPLESLVLRLQGILAKKRSKGASLFFPKLFSCENAT